MLPKSVSFPLQEKVMGRISQKSSVHDQEGNGSAQLRDDSYIPHSFVEAVTLKTWGSLTHELVLRGREATDPCLVETGVSYLLFVRWGQSPSWVFKSSDCS